MGYFVGHVGLTIPINTNAFFQCFDVFQSRQPARPSRVFLDPVSVQCDVFDKGVGPLGFEFVHRRPQPNHVGGKDSIVPR